LYPQAALEREFLPRPVRGYWERVQEFEPFGEVGQGFAMGGTVDGVLASPLPVGNGGLVEPCCGVVMRQEFGLVCRRLGELLGQHLHYLLMVLLPGAL
jgi:hypothetical protein